MFAKTRTILILLCGFAISILAGPLKRECGEACFNSTNECGAPFGGCWNDCVQQRPTFTAPLCPATIAEAASRIATPVLDITIIPASPTITPSPDLSSGTTKSGCNSGTTMCIDMILECNGRNIMYGGCDDICSSVVYTAPPCTVTPVPTMPWRGNGTAKPTKVKAQRPPTTRTPCGLDKPKWMCAPSDW